MDRPDHSARGGRGSVPCPTMAAFTPIRVNEPTDTIDARGMGRIYIYMGRSAVTKELTQGVEAAIWQTQPSAVDRLTGTPQKQ